MLDVGLERKIVTKSGSYFSVGDERLGQGRRTRRPSSPRTPISSSRSSARIQADVGPEQVVSARLLPSGDASQIEVEPVPEEVLEEVRAEA